LGRAVAIDLAADLPPTGRFVIVDDYEIRGGGIIREALSDRQKLARAKVLRRNYKWEPSFVPLSSRAERYRQRPTLVLISSPHDVDRKRVAKELEVRLFDEGRLVYFLGMGSVVYGVDADLDRTTANRGEHVRRLGEVANIILEAGMIFIATAAELSREELELIRTSADPDRTVTVWIGESSATDVDPDLFIDADEEPAEGAERLRGFLLSIGALLPA